MAKRAPAMPGKVDPSAAAKRPLRSGFRPWGINDGATFRILAMPVLTPFIDISMHVIQAPLVGLKTSHRNCLVPEFSPVAARLRVVSIIIRLICGETFSKIKRSGGFRSGGMLPFRLGGEPTSALPFRFVQLFDKLPGVIPGDIFHRAIISILRKP